MKRLISLLLAVALLLSLAPAVLADGAEQPDVALVIGKPSVVNDTDKKNNPVSYYAVPVSVKNNTEKTIQLTMFECYIEYDAKNFKGVKFRNSANTRIEGVTYNGVLAGNQWTGAYNVTNGRASVSSGMINSSFDYADDRIVVAANSSVQMFTVNLQKLNDNVENGSYPITFAEPFQGDDTLWKENMLGFSGEVQTDETEDGEPITEMQRVQYNQLENGVDCTSSDFITVEGGKVPTLDAITVKKAAAEYASGDVLTLSATSASGNPVTELVNFTITKEGKDYTQSKGFYIDGDKLTVNKANPASVGEYTITATSLDETKCTTPTTPVTATFTITPATINTADVTITGFGKGLPVADAKATADNMTVTCSWYTGEGTTGEENAVSDGNFAVSTTYTLVLMLTPANGNYALAENASVTVNGLDGQKTASLTISGNSGVAIVTGTTGAKDKTKRASGTNLGSTGSVRYGDMLGSVQLVAEPNTDGLMVVAYIDGKETAISVPGKFEWKYPNDKVGDACELGKANRHKVVFKPDNDDLYEGFEEWVGVSVQKKVLNISDLVWTWSNDTLTYTGKPQSIEMNIPTGIAEYVDVTYGNETEGHTNTATNAGTYTAAAVVTPKDANNISLGGTTADDQIRRVITKEWKINKAELTLPDKEFNAYYKSASVDKTLDDLGLSDLADEPELDLSFSNLESTEYAANVNKVTDANGKITGISIELPANSRVNDVVGVHVTVSSKNYEDAGFNIRITLEDKAQDTTTMTVSVADITYGETPNPQVTGKPAETSDLTYSYVRTDLSASPKYDEETIQNAPAGKYELTVTCENATKYFIATDTFEIKPRTITKDDVTFGSDLTYNGAEQTKSMTIAKNGYTLVVGMDYDITGGTLKGIEPGNYELTITCKGNYAGEFTVSFEIKKAPLSSVRIGNIFAEYQYTGAAQEPTPDLAFEKATGVDETLVSDYDYTLSYTNNTNVGTATITITAKDTSEHFTGSTKTTFEIIPVSVTTSTDITVDKIPDQTYDATPKEPKVTVRFKGTPLEEGKDYLVTYKNNLNATGGTSALAEITGKGNFTGTNPNNAFIINKANLNLPSENPVLTHVYTETGTKTYTLPSNMFLANETNKSFTIESVVCTNNDIFKVAPHASEDGTVEYELNGEKGEAIAQISIKPNSNYNSGLLSIEIKVVDKTDVSNNISFPDGSAIYTGSGIKYEAATLNGNFVSMTYTYAVKDGGELKDGLPLTVGTYTVTASYEDSKSFGSKTATFSITKATPPTPAEVKVDGEDKTLKDLEDSMRKDLGKIEGEFTWRDSDGKELHSDTKIEANKEYEWIFTPKGNDAKNYFPISGKTTPYVRDDLSWLPGVLGGGSTFNFRDVTRYDYFYNAVKWAAENGIASGTSRYTFSPDAVCTRAQTVTFLWRAAGSPMPSYRISPFTDVNYGDYYYNAVLWAVEQGITTGLTATTFGPDKTVTRGQVAMFLYRAASAVKPNITNSFTDVKSTAYNYDAILWAYDNRITTGTSTTTFSPDAFCTRAQIVTFLYRFYQGR